jgi:dGTPase
MKSPAIDHLSTRAKYACDEKLSRGRQHRESDPGYRTQYQRDRDRIVHCAAFRRLEYKTQVFVNHEGDLFRTRLTHSIEVAQIARSISRTLRLHEDLVEAISLAHDLGHTPFGHAGQDALNSCMREFGGFEHNLQSLRVIDWLEEKYAEFNGLNLMFETREGILKHCSKKVATELGELGKRFLEKKQPSLEAQLANISDEIAYTNHDVDDGLRSGIVTIEQLMETEIFNNEYKIVEQKYPKLGQRRQVHEIVRRMINRQVTDLINTSQKNIERANPGSVEAIREHGVELITFSQQMLTLHNELKSFLRQNLYKHYQVRRMTVKAQRVIKDIFEAYMNDPLLLPNSLQDQLQEPDPWPFLTNKHSRTARVIADYIAGMTDRYAINEHDRLFDPVHSG